MTPPGTGGTAAKIRRGLAVSAVNSIVVRLGNVLLGIVLARLLAPAEFGIFAVALTCQMILLAVADFGLSADLIRRGDVDRRGPTTAVLALGLSGTLAALMVAFADQVAAALGDADAGDSVRVLALTIVLSGVSVVPFAVLQRAFMQGRLFQADAASLAVQAVVVLTLVQTGSGPLALAWSRVAGQLVAVLLLFVFARRAPRFAWDRTIARESLRFGAPMAAANLVSWALLGVDYAVVGRLLGPEQLGFYVLAFNVSAWPIAALGQAVQNVALPAFAQQDQAREQLGRSLARATALTWTAAGWMSTMITVLALPLVVSLYGARWAAAAAALAGLGLFGGLRLVLNVLAAFLVSQGATRRLLMVQLVWIAALIPALVLGTSELGIRGTALAHLVAAAVVALPAHLWAVRSVGVRVGPVLRGAVLPVFAAAVSGAAAWAVTTQVGGTWLQLMVGGTVGSAVYLVVVARSLRGLLRPGAAYGTGSSPTVPGPTVPDPTVNVSVEPAQRHDTREAIS